MPSTLPIMSAGFSTSGTPNSFICFVKPSIRSGESFDSPGQPMTIFAPSTNCSLSLPIWLRRLVNSTQCDVSKSRMPSLIMGGTRFESPLRGVARLLSSQRRDDRYTQDTRCRGGCHHEPDDQHQAEQRREPHPRNRGTAGHVRSHRRERCQHSGAQTNEQEQCVFDQHEKLKRPRAVTDGAEQREFAESFPHAAEDDHRKPQHAEQQSEAAKKLERGEIRSDHRLKRRDTFAAGRDHKPIRAETRLQHAYNRVLLLRWRANEEHAIAILLGKRAREL